LQGGNRQQVTLLDNGQEKAIFVEASPQFKSLSFYETGGRRARMVMINCILPLRILQFS
jgi:hypothetical protein